MAGKAKDLASLLRLRRWSVDERQRELGVLQGQEDMLVRAGEELDRQLVREQEVAASDPTTAGFTYAAFAENHRLRRENLERVLAELRGQIEQARDRLAEAYRDLKVLEEVEKERRRQERVEEARRDQAMFDEIGQTQFRLKQK